MKNYTKTDSKIVSINENAIMAVEPHDDGTMKIHLPGSVFHVYQEKATIQTVKADTETISETNQQTD